MLSSARALRSPWSVLQTPCLDIPTRKDPGHTSLTWGALSESLEFCLLGITLHVAQCVDDRAHLESIVTEIFVGNLDLLVSHLGDREKLRSLTTAADLLLERGPPPSPDETEACVERRSKRDGSWLARSTNGTDPCSATVSP
jgi:hypothetical protein